jgi:Flp pilus assembly protein TadG
MIHKHSSFPRQLGGRGRRSPVRQPRRRGASAVELAFVAPIFFLLILGMIELGRGLMVRHMLTNAARQGCRLGILEGKSNADVTAVVHSALTPVGISSDTVSILVNGGSSDVKNANADDEVTVIVSVPVTTVTWVPGGQYLGSTLSGQYTLRKE